MSDELTPEQVAELVEQIDRGSDPYELPQALIEETEPSAAPAADEREVERSLYYQILKMTVGEKLKAALKGNRDTRNILVRDGWPLPPGRASTPPLDCRSSVHGT